MEWALSAARREDLGRIDDPWRGPAERREAVEKLFGPVKFSRLYFGQEFCERLIPKVRDLMEAVGVSRRGKLGFTLVTPYVTEKGLAMLEELFGELSAGLPGAEVVVNDWGALYLLRRRFLSLEPVLGRLLNKALRDPRLTGGLSSDDLSRNKKLYRACSLSGPYMKKLINWLGVKRVELDNLIQGLDDGIPRWGFRVSLYLPFGCITTGRICLLGSWGLERSKKFNASAKSCSRECGIHRLELTGPGFRDSAGCRIVQMGNTVFYDQTGPLFASGLARSRALGVSRIVYQPKPL